MMIKTWFAILPAVLFLFAAFAVVSCGDDDDDDDSTNPNVDKCMTYDEKFFGSGGCFDDETYYTSIEDACSQLESVELQAKIDQAFACMDELNCEDYDTSLSLYTDGVIPCFQYVLQ